MHPIFKSRSSFLAYLIAWIPLGSMLGFVLSVSGHLRWTESVSITAPLTVVLAFVCLSSWYSCRFLSLGSTPVWKLLTHHIIAAICVSAIALVITRILVASFSGLFPMLNERFRPAVPVLAGMISLVY